MSRDHADDAVTFMLRAIEVPSGTPARMERLRSAQVHATLALRVEAQGLAAAVGQLHELALAFMVEWRDDRERRREREAASVVDLRRRR